MCAVKVVDSLPVERWREFVARHPDGSIFHTPEMFEVFQRTEGHEPSMRAAVDADGCPLALLLPVRITLFGGPLRTLTSRSVVYGSILWEPGEAGLQALDALLAAYVRETRRAVLFTELRNLVEIGSGQPVLQEHGFAHQEHLNYLIDLDRSPEELMQGIGARTRKNIRRELNRGRLAVEEVTEEQRIEAWYAVLQKTYANAHVPLAGLSLFQAARQVLLPKGMVRFTQATEDSAIAATSVELLYKDKVFGWYGGVDREWTRHAPNELLMWTILSWGQQNGYKVYDFGGAGKPGEAYGPRDFKAKFGGRLVNYGREVFVGSPLAFKLSTVAYEIYRKFI